MEQLTPTEIKKNNIKALVTGATGMVGSRLVVDLVLAGYTVLATYRNKNRIAQFWKNIAGYEDIPSELESKFEWIELDIASYTEVLEILGDVDVVFHTAAFVSFHPSDKKTMFETNITGTANVVNACLEKNHPKLVHVSSIAALGKTSNGEQIHEDTSWTPEQKHSAYSISKFHSEMEVWRGIEEGLDAVIVNPSVILGPGDWRSGSPSFFRNIHDGLAFYPKGSTGFVDVRDVTKAMIFLAQPDVFPMAKNKRYLLNAENITYREFFEKVALALEAIPPRIATSDFMLSIGWRLAWIFGKLTHKKVSITRDSVSGANSISMYSGNKICREWNFSYRPLDLTIKEIAAMYLKQE